MRENLDQWEFVIACYIVTIVAALAMTAFSWNAMRKSEARREEVKRK